MAQAPGTQEKGYPPPAEVQKKAHIKSMAEYRKIYQESISDPEGFWGKVAERITWYKKWDRVRRYDFDEGEIEWYGGGKLNASYNCLDRHLKTRGDQPALIWEGDDPSVSKTLTYRELHEEVCRFANVLKGFDSVDNVSASSVGTGENSTPA